MERLFEFIDPPPTVRYPEPAAPNEMELENRRRADLLRMLREAAMEREDAWSLETRVRHEMGDLRFEEVRDELERRRIPLPLVHYPFVIFPTPNGCVIDLPEELE